MMCEGLTFGDGTQNIGMMQVIRAGASTWPRPASVKKENGGLHYIGNQRTFLCSSCRSNYAVFARYDSLSFYCLDCGLKSLEVRGLLPGGERTVRS